MFISAWAVAETYVDMNYLINGGYKIPLFKTKDNLILTLDPSEWTEGKDLKSHYQEKGILFRMRIISLFCCLYREKKSRSWRTADLIEMNMKKNGWKFHDGKCVYIPAGGKCDVGPLYVWKCDTVSGGIRKEWCNGTDEV